MTQVDKALLSNTYLRMDAAQGATALEKGRGIANLDAGLLAGMRDKLINGRFDIWQRATSHTSSGYGSVDRWASYNVGSTKTVSRQAFTLGQTDVPGEPQYFVRTVVTSVAGANNLVNLAQNIESVRTLAGRKATLTFWAKADAAKNIGVLIQQYFGSGGSPSASVNASTGLKALTTVWQKFTIVVDLPSIAGKTLGSGGNDGVFIAFYFEAGASVTQAGGVGQQSGTFDIANVSFVEGDATTEDNPPPARHLGQELTLCRRFFRLVRFRGLATATAANEFLSNMEDISDMRNAPIASVPVADALTNIGALNTVVDGTPALGMYLQVYGLSSAAGNYAFTAIRGLDAEI